MTCALLLAGCASAPSAKAEAAREPAPSTVVTLPEPARAASVARPESTPERDPAPSAERSPASPGADEGESICDIDPEICKPLDPKAAAKCGCGKLSGREQQKCLIDCVHRERNELDRRIRRGDFGPS